MRRIESWGEVEVNTKILFILERGGEDYRWVGEITKKYIVDDGFTIITDYYKLFEDYNKSVKNARFENKWFVSPDPEWKVYEISEEDYKKFKSEILVRNL